MATDTITYQIHSLDVWGHVHADCEADCRCGGPEGDPNADCECDQQVNDCWNAGKVTVPRDADDKAIIAALVESGHLTGLGAPALNDMSTAGERPMVVDSAGRWLYELVAEND